MSKIRPGSFKNKFFKRPLNIIPVLKYDIVKTVHHQYIWEFDVWVGEDYMATVCHSPTSPSFITWEGADMNMREYCASTAETIVREAYHAQYKGYRLIKRGQV